jgi:hypothetical protein
VVKGSLPGTAIHRPDNSAGGKRSDNVTWENRRKTRTSTGAIIAALNRGRYRPKLQRMEKNCWRKPSNLLPNPVCDADGLPIPRVRSIPHNGGAFGENCLLRSSALALRIRSGSLCRLALGATRSQFREHSFQSGFEPRFQPGRSGQLSGAATPSRAPHGLSSACPLLPAREHERMQSPEAQSLTIVASCSWMSASRS